MHKFFIGICTAALLLACQSASALSYNLNSAGYIRMPFDISSEESPADDWNTYFFMVNNYLNKIDTTKSGRDLSIAIDLSPACVKLIETANVVSIYNVEFTGTYRIAKKAYRIAGFVMGTPVINNNTMRAVKLACGRPLGSAGDIRAVP